MSTNFNGDRISNIGDPIFDKDGVNLRTLKKLLPQLVDTIIYKTSIITTPTATLDLSNNYYGIIHNGEVNLTLPNPTGFDGYNFSIKDESGNAATYRIRIIPSSGKIDNNDYVDMNLNYMSLHLLARGGNWWII